MTENQYKAHLWLSRMWYADIEIRILEERVVTILGAKITSYGQEHLGGSDPNPTESKNIEYSLLVSEIERKKRELREENVKTYHIIQKLNDFNCQGVLYAMYVDRKSYTQVGTEFNYEKTQVYKLRNRGLTELYQYIPKEDLARWIE